MCFITSSSSQPSMQYVPYDAGDMAVWDSPCPAPVQRFRSDAKEISVYESVGFDSGFRAWK